MMLWVAALVMALGVFWHAVATLGFIRMPDFYSRMHAVSMGDTLGIALVLCAVAIVEAVQGSPATSVKLGFIVGFYFLGSPSAGHALARAALRSGLDCWRVPGSDAADAVEVERARDADASAVAARVLRAESIDDDDGDGDPHEPVGVITE